MDDFKSRVEIEVEVEVVDISCCGEQTGVMVDGGGATFLYYFSAL